MVTSADGGTPDGSHGPLEFMRCFTRVLAAWPIVVLNGQQRCGLPRERHSLDC